MTNVLQLVGTYQYKNKKLSKGNDLKLLIANRGNVTATKTPLFLLDKTTVKGGYISSLYPLSADVFNFDYKGFKFELKINEVEEVAIISHVLIS